MRDTEIFALSIHGYVLNSCPYADDALAGSSASLPPPPLLSET